MAICSVVTDRCVEPAGWRSGLGYAVNKGGRLRRCWQCGEPVCTSCSTEVGRSLICLQCQADNAVTAGLA